MERENLKVIIVEDDKDIADALVWVMKSVQLEAEVYQDALSFLNAYHPEMKGCLILDVRMPGMSGLDLQEELIKRHNQMPIIFISGHGDIPMAVRAISKGAFDFITKPFNTQHIIELVQRALLVYIKNKELKHVKDMNRKKLLSLSDREKNILEKIANGKENKEIAYSLNLAISTIELHRAKLMKKLEVRNMAELIRLYVMFSQEPHSTLAENFF